ncbi:transposase [Mesorhizobium sp. M1163]|uniref:transposase n=1 Tax=Mesorhizobium sp. M1163 TaxID=2957065 RepID=UPI0033383BEE
MSPSFDASKSRTALDQDSTLVAVIKMSQTQWLIAAMVPGRQPHQGNPPSLRHSHLQTQSAQGCRELEALHTAEGMPLPERSRAELRRNLGWLHLLREQIHEIEQERLRQLSVVPDTKKGPLAMVRLLARIIGVGIETADMLVNEILSRGLRDRRAVARYAGLTGAPDESGQCRREKGRARAECSRPLWHHPVGLAVPPVPKG